MLTVGTDCALGKMTVCLELDLEARRRGLASVFVPTGQTGIAIAGWGIAVDEVVSDFVAGATERLVVEGAERGGPGALLWIEGQGSINHPLYSGVTLGLLHGSAPHVMLLVHEPGRTHIDMPDGPTMPPLPQLIENYERIAAYVRPAPIVGVALKTNQLDEAAARAAAGQVTEPRPGCPPTIRCASAPGSCSTRCWPRADGSISAPWPTPDSTRWPPCCAGIRSKSSRASWCWSRARPARPLLVSLTRELTRLGAHPVMRPPWT